MHIRLLATALGLACTTAAVARAQDTTKAPAQDRTLFGLSFLRGGQIAMGAGSVPYLKTPPQHGPNTLEFRLGIVFTRWPDWTFALASSGVPVSIEDTTVYAVGSNQYHPPLSESSGGFEVQRRWRSSSLVHPLVTAGIGTIRQFYPYRSGLDGAEHTDGDASTKYYELSAGGELNLTGWFRMTMAVGYRQAGSYALLPSGSMSNSGLRLTNLFAFGRF